MNPIATPADIRKAAERKVSSVVKEVVRGNADAIFPIGLRVKLKPSGTPKPSLESYAAATQQLLAASKEKTGSGYTLHLSRRNSRQYGEQDFPDRVTVDSLADFRFLAGCGQRFDAVTHVCNRIRESLPTLEPWLIENATRLHEHADDIDDLIAVTSTLLAHPMPDCYLRELDVPVDTKFIESHQRILIQWLDRLLSPSAIDTSESKFARRYGLRDGQIHHLIRVLDDTMLSQLRFPCCELSLPLRELAKLSLRDIRVVIVENRTTLLTLPQTPMTIALGGVGDSVTRFRELTWLHDCDLFYWGDLDVDGFRILANLRYWFPKSKNLLMDQATYQAHKTLAIPGNGKTLNRHQNLSDDENAILQELSQSNDRIEQEKIDRNHIQKEWHLLLHGNF